MAAYYMSHTHYCSKYRLRAGQNRLESGHFEIQLSVNSRPALFTVVGMNGALPG